VGLYIMWFSLLQPSGWYDARELHAG
jgi:hypothetical protein